MWFYSSANEFFSLIVWVSWQYNFHQKHARLLLYSLPSVILGSFFSLPLLNIYLYYGFISEGFTRNLIFDIKLNHAIQLKSFTQLSWIHWVSGASWLPNHFWRQVSGLSIVFWSAWKLANSVWAHLFFETSYQRKTTHWFFLKHSLKQWFSKYGLHTPRNPKDSFSGSTRWKLLL